MCGRYTIRATRDEIAEAFGAVPRQGVPTAFTRYNLAPRQTAPLVRAAEAQRVLDTARWGFVPSWAEDPEALKTQPINARADRAARSPMFRRALARGRCLVPAHGFFEWQKRPGGGPKRPHLIRPKNGGLFAFAGIRERWEGAEPLETFAILTTEPNELLAKLHDRMPVILSAEAWDRWLDPGADDPAALAPLLGPAPADDWEAVPVSRIVNRPARDEPACVEPVAAEDDDADGPALF